MEPLFPELERELEYTRDYIERIYKFYGYGMWVIVEKKSQLVVGRVGLEYKEGFDGLELGFMLGVEYQHKGYAYEACEAVLRYGKEELGQTKFCACVDEDNIASANLCVKLGFIETKKEKNRKIFVMNYY
jgi:RimJ/RimL family protein N-acetyltransferase